MTFRAVSLLSNLPFTFLTSTEPKIYHLHLANIKFEEIPEAFVIRSFIIIYFIFVNKLVLKYSLSKTAAI